MQIGCRGFGCCASVSGCPGFERPVELPDEDHVLGTASVTVTTGRQPDQGLGQTRSIRRKKLHQRKSLLGWARLRFLCELLLRPLPGLYCSARTRSRPCVGWIERCFPVDSAVRQNPGAMAPECWIHLGIPFRLSLPFCFHEQSGNDFDAEPILLVPKWNERWMMESTTHLCAECPARMWKHIRKSASLSAM